MTTLYTDLYPNRVLLLRQYFWVPGTFAVVAPAGATYLRAAAVGAGGSYPNVGSPPKWGGGAAFARVQDVCVGGEQFSVQVGDIAHSSGAGDGAGDSKLTRVTGTVVILKAERGKGVAAPNKGLAANSVGDVKRDGVDGSTGVNSTGGAAGSDAADTYQLGFNAAGMSGQTAIDGARLPQAGPGGGGAADIRPDYTGNGPVVGTWTYPPGPGGLCLEFYLKNPGVWA